MSNTLQVMESHTQALMIEMPKVAMSVPLAKIQTFMLIAEDGNAPHFDEQSQPVLDNQTFSAVGGARYYRPNLRVGQRSLPLMGPAVRFLKDAQGKTRLEFELEEDPMLGLPAGAQPLSIRVGQVNLTWSENNNPRSRLFDAPMLMPEDPGEDGTKPHFSLRVGTDLISSEVEGLYHALTEAESNATLQVTLEYGYWRDSVVITHDDSSGIPIEIPPKRRWLRGIPRDALGTNRTHLMMAQPFASIGAGTLASFNEGQSEATLHRSHGLELASALVSGGATLTPAVSESPLSAIVLTDSIASERILDFRHINSDWFNRVDDQNIHRTEQSDFTKASLVRTISFLFDPTLDANKPIYSEIRESESLTEAWENTPFGMMRRAPYANTVYRLPNLVRLAFHPGLGTPHMIPVLYRKDDEQGETRIRVTLRAIPWHDPEALVKLRDSLYVTSAGALASPSIVVGGYDSAKLRLTTAFPEQIQVIGSEDIPVSLDRGFELTLDLSLEFYSFLCQLLVGPVGLTGVVTVTMTNPSVGGNLPQQTTYAIDMRLNLGEVTDLPIEVQVAKNQASPTQVQILNKSGNDMKIGNCLPRLLQYDTNSVVPIGVFGATAALSVFPTILPADGLLDVALIPEERFKDSLWNSVQVELTHQALVKPAAEVLNRVHEVAPSGELSWEIKVECPLFQREPISPQFENVFRVEAQIERTGFAPQKVALGRGEATGKVMMQRTLRDLIGSGAVDASTFSYQIRNIYFDHAGQWSEKKQGEGVNLFVFPNPTLND